MRKKDLNKYPKLKCYVKTDKCSAKNKMTSQSSFFRPETVMYDNDIQYACCCNTGRASRKPILLMAKRERVSEGDNS